MSSEHQHYYVPAQSPWPIVGSIGLFLTAMGAAMFVQQSTGKHMAYDLGIGHYVLSAGLLILLFMMFGWFRHVIQESMQGLYSDQMDRSFRQGMMWFICSEVMFFAAFFGALFYVRLFAVPWLGGEGSNFETAVQLWPDFVPLWPLLETPAGQTTQAMGAWGLPLINTVILLTSSVTLTWAHWALIKEDRKRLIGWMTVTVLLGAFFLFLQVEEYIHAYNDLGLTLSSGIYGSTFFMLTGFHGFHVTIGTIFLLIMLLRCLKGHFSPKSHFAFEAGAWYWHFVDVVWLFLFIFVYWL